MVTHGKAKIQVAVILRVCLTEPKGLLAGGRRQPRDNALGSLGDLAAVCATAEAAGRDVDTLHRALYAMTDEGRFLQEVGKLPDTPASA